MNSNLKANDKNRPKNVPEWNSVRIHCSRPKLRLKKDIVTNDFSIFLNIVRIVALLRLRF